MKKLPDQLLNALEGIPGYNRESFIEVHTSGDQVTSIRINANKPSNDFESTSPVPWTRFGYYLKERPSFTFDPLFHAGCYYVQEASSMFLEQAFRQLTDLSMPLKVLDLCGAPGGKSTHIQSLISENSLLVCNEVIKGRTLVLMDNVVKWGAVNTIVTNNDPAVFGSVNSYFDVMVVDAPCSGSGLFRRDEEAINEWNLNNVQLCSQRQQRILSDALPALKENGLLVYSTCSYSVEEDEAIMDWLVREWEMENCPLQLEENWNIVPTISQAGAEGYRFYPDRLRGEGFFLACFRKSGRDERGKPRAGKTEKISAREKEILQPWSIRQDVFMKIGQEYFSMAAAVQDGYQELKDLLNIRYAGICMGEIMKNRMIPHHALALSPLVSYSVDATELNYSQSIRYLQRAEIQLSTHKKGWQLVQYKGRNLGWINVLPNRINNYYPKELRILKQGNGPFEK